MDWGERVGRRGQQETNHFFTSAKVPASSFSSSYNIKLTCIHMERHKCYILASLDVGLYICSPQDWLIGFHLNKEYCCLYVVVLPHRASDS